MRIIICDVDKKYLKLQKDDLVYNNITNYCKGCFSCWLKTPLKCIYNDALKSLGENMRSCDELIIISKGKYGCYSPLVKGILERSISYVKPYFVLRNKEIHHEARTSKKIKFKVIFYEYENIETLTKLVNRNSINYNTLKPDIYFIDNLNGIGDLI